MLACWALTMKKHVLDLDTALAELEALSIHELRNRFAETLGYRSESRSRTFLVRKILWGLQAAEGGDISEEEHQRALEMADLRTLKHRLPGKRKPHAVAIERVNFTRDVRMPTPGTILCRQYKGKELRMTILPDGVEWRGQVFQSLSKAVSVATGTKWNGYAFFGLGGRP